MKHNMNRILTTMALLVLTTMTAWAEQKVNITITPANSGTVTYAISNGVCTLTAKPADGYYLTVDNLTAVATLDGGAVQSPRRRIDVVDGTPLEVSYATGDDPSATTTYTIAMPADANLNVEVTAEFQSRTSIDGATVTVAVPEGGIIYNGGEQKPAIASVVLANGTALTSADYTVSGYSNNIKAGNSAEVTVTGQGKYKGSATGTFAISKAVATVTKAPEALNPTYTGAAQNLVTAGETESGTVVYSLSADGEFSETIPQATNVGSYTVYYKATGDDNHSESAVGNVTATIAKADLGDVTIGTIADQTFTGSEIKPAVTVMFNGKAVAADEYSVAYSNNINAGTATVTLTSKDKNFSTTNTKSATFKIVQAEASLSYNIYELTTAINVTPIWPELNNPKGAIVAYSSSNLDVATIDENGSITIVGTGETTIKAAVNDPNYKDGEATYKLKVTGYAYNLKIDGQVVTDDNRKTLFNNSVMFDGKERLTLTNAHITSIESGLEALEIYVIGNNVIETTINDNAILDLTNGHQTLNIITDETKPGTLTMSCVKKVVSGFRKVSIKAPMAIMKPEGMKKLNEGNSNYALLCSPLDPIVNNDDKNSTIDYGSGDPEDPLTNIVIDDVLYTLNDLQEAGLNDDGTYNGMLIINSTMTDGDLEKAIKMIPTTEEYAKTFKGITFMVPAGSGTVTITAMTQIDHTLCVKVGNMPATLVQTNGELKSIEIPYACQSATYIYVYHVESSGAASAPAEGNHRIGPKATVSTGVTGLSVSANNIDTPPAGMSDYLSFSRADLRIPESGVGHIVVANASITDLDDDAFVDLTGASANASRRAFQNYDITYIDLRGTSITGKEFSREEGPFKGLPETTFVYLPAGNEVSSPNMVVGSVCNEMSIGDGNHTFECVEEGFVASRAMLERWFHADEKYPVYVPFDIKDPEKYGIFFEYSGISDGMVTMNKTTTIAANTPYYLQAKEGGVDIIEEAGVKVNPVTSIPSTGMIGTYKPEWLPDAYFYDNETKKFQKVADVLPFEAYLNIEGSAPLTVWWEGEEKPTAVDVVRRNNEIGNNRWYSLDGRQLQQHPVEKGIYLKNGKKYIVK